MTEKETFCSKLAGRFATRSQIPTVIKSKIPEAVTAPISENYYLLGPDLKSNQEFRETDEEVLGENSGRNRHRGNPMPNSEVKVREAKGWSSW